MADMGFMPQITHLLDQVRPGGQRMLFSATLDRNVDLLVRRYLTDPVVNSVDPSAGAVTTMEHHVLHIQGADKQATTVEIAARDGRVIMFLDTKRAVDRLTENLLNSGVRAAALHRGKSQPQRTRTLAQFKVEIRPDPGRIRGLAGVPARLNARCLCHDLMSHRDHAISAG